MEYRNKHIDLDPAKVYVVLMRYGWKKKGIAKFTAPLVRLFTGKRFNHCGLLYSNFGKWQFFESNEKGCHKTPAEIIEAGVDRKGSTIEIREYTGPMYRTEIGFNACNQLGKKYDTWNLVFHQPIYRLTRIWIGPKNLKAKKRVQCFEFLYNCFGIDLAWLASGAEFDRLPEFKTIVFSEL